MSVLSITQLEKRNGNTVLFPPFDLHLQHGEAAAIHCNAEIGFQLIQMMIGKSSLSGGEILLFGSPLNLHYKHLSNRVGLAFLNDRMYERLTTKDYLRLFKGLYGISTDIDKILQMVGLQENRSKSIKKLTYSEIKRLNIARAIIHQPDLIILEEPDQNVDLESKIIIKKIIDYLVTQDKTILLTTSNLESAISLAHTVYHLNETGLKKQEIVEEGTERNEHDGPSRETSDDIISQPIQFNKIPAKVNDKLILFDPTEIDYIESHDGISHLFIKGETFPCSFTLNELHDRLHAFGFFRCHRSYIVNLQKVREIITWTRNSYSLVLDDVKKSSIPLSKGKMNELKQIIGM
ncbi:MAG: LytTR family transcriptional regulator DNA-binding domain-containing protein [Bacillus sp. (in: firmicutes)]